MMENIAGIYREYRDRILEIRRHLHRYPELGDREFETTEYLEGILLDLGLSVDRPLETGLSALLLPEAPAERPGTEGDPFGICVGVRSDIDALPVKERCDLPFRSEREGLMHACGHDVHMAAVAGAAMILSRPDMRKQLTAPVRFFFQPAEETDGGAARMIEAGCLREPRVDTMVGFHCEPDLPAGEIGIKYGYARASSDMFDIVVRGRSSHGAYPEQGVDAIITASQIVLSVQAMVSRQISTYEPCVVTIGKFHGGSAENVVCDEVVLTGTMRTASPDVREFALRHLREIAEHTAASFGASAELRLRPGYIALYNDPKPTALLRRCAEELSGTGQVKILDNTTMSVDDFSFFAKEVPSVYFFAGTGYRDRVNAGLHQSTFEVNEEAFDTIVPLLTGYILRAGRNESGL